MENFYELDISRENELTFKCKGMFVDLNEYNEKIYSKYDFEKESDVQCVFSDSELNRLKDRIFFELNTNLNAMYYGFSYHGTFDQLGVFDDKESFESDFFGEFDAYEDYIFYGDHNKMNSIVELIDKTIELNSISNDEVLSYFDNNVNNIERLS